MICSVNLILGYILETIWCFKGADYIAMALFSRLLFKKSYVISIAITGAPLKEVLFNKTLSTDAKWNEIVSVIIKHVPRVAEIDDFFLLSSLILSSSSNCNGFGLGIW